MAQGKMNHRVEGDKVLVLEREFDAPRDLVFEMFADSEHLKHWWGPRGWDLPVSRLDFREGGSWLYCMRCVDESQGEFYGQESWGKMVYAQIVRPERIVYTDYFTDAEGNVDTSLPASDTVLEFVDLGGRTRLVSRTTYATPEALKTVLDMGMLPGITQTWDRLEERLAAVA